MNNPILPTFWRLFYAAYYASALVRTLVVFAGALTLEAVLLGALFFSGVRASASALMGTARVVQVPCGRDLDATVNTDPSTTPTRFELGRAPIV